MHTAWAGSVLDAISRHVCLCGQCRERARDRAGELRAQARRLGLASFRASDYRDILRAAAYAKQAAAATAEARRFEREVAALHTRPHLLRRVAAMLAHALRLFTPMRCKRLPDKWSGCVV